ncbi:MAG: DUF4247 domain-containing protein [Sciscionella sp.]
MTLRTKLIVAGSIAAVGVIALVIAFTRIGGVRGYLADTYTRSSGRGDSVVYTSRQQPRTVYDDIRSSQQPAKTVVQPSGYYLRYSDDIVVVSGRQGGSRIYLDDARRGYHHWFPVIGGLWGTYRGPGESFRGGGPGAGK